MYEYPEQIDHAFPLRRDLTLRLVLPVDLTHADVDRLARWMHSLVFEEERQAVAELAAAPEPAPPPALLPAGAAAPGPELVIARTPRVVVVGGGGSQLFDLWGTVLAARGSTPRDAARVVGGEEEPWSLLEPLAGVEVHAGSFGGAAAEDGQIVTFRGRAHSVFLHDLGVRGMLVDNDPSKSSWKADGDVPLRPIGIAAYAPAGAKIYRIAWACATQKLELLASEKLPAGICKFTLKPTQTVTELRIFWAMWIG